MVRKCISGSGSARICRVGIFTVIAILSASICGNRALAASAGPLDGYTGAPSEASGTEPNCTSCHSEFVINSGPGLLSIDAPETYQPGITYEITVLVTHIGRRQWGFELTAIDEALFGAGELVPGLDGFTQVSTTGSRDYAKQTSLGTADGQLDQQAWTLSWIAPQTDIGPVTFHAAGVAGNSTGGSSGDDVYTAAVGVPEPSFLSLQLVGWIYLIGLKSLSTQRSIGSAERASGIV